MTEMNPVGYPGSSDLAALAAKLNALELELAKSARQTRGRNHVIVISGILTIIFLIGYLGYAYQQFSTYVTPDLVAVNVQAQFQQALPQAKQQLQDNLKANAPKYVSDVLDHFQKLPMDFADNLHKEASDQLDKEMPSVEDSLYKSLKSQLDIAAQQASKGNDEQRFQSMLDALSAVYAAETLKFVDQVHSDYASQAVAYTDYLDKLGKNEGLDHKDQLYRKMFRTAFMLVREHDKTSGKTNEIAVPALTTPAQ